jgi:hypothetical protein
MIIGVVTNQSKSTCELWCRSQDSYYNIALIDSAGKAVERTAFGSFFSNWPDASQLAVKIKNARTAWLKGHARTEGFVRLSPGGDWPLRQLKISDLFVVKKSGEYTLLVQVRFTEKVESAGGDPEFKATMLPDVSVKVHIENKPKHGKALLPKH